MGNPGISRDGRGVVPASITDPTAAAARALSIGSRFGQVVLAPTGSADGARDAAVLAATQGLYPVERQDGAWALAGAELAPHGVTFDSLAHGDLSSMSWRVMAPTLAPAVRQMYASTAKYPVARTKLWLNYDSLCPLGGYLERPVTIPAGVTEIKLELDEVIQGPGGATGDFALQLYDATGVTQVSSTTFTPGAAAADCTTAAITVTPGAEYRVRVVCDVAGTQSTFVCGALRVRPVTSSVAFWTRGFVRVEASASNLQDNAETIAWDNPRFPRQSEYCHLDLETTAGSVVLEVYDNCGDYVLGTNDNLCVLVDGMPLAPVDPTIGAVSFNTVTIPAGADGPRSVSIVSGPQASSGLPTTAPEPRGTFLCAAYLPITRHVRVLPAAGETVVLYGDSKLAGFYSSIPGRDSVAMLLRRRGYRVISECYGGRSLFADATATLTTAACATIARKLGRYTPQRIVVGIGRNDFANAILSPADLVTQYGNLLDEIHTICPQALVQILTWTHEGTEADVGGVSWETERANIYALAASRASWCTVLDAARMWSVAEAGTYTGDTVHPNDAGYERIDRIVAGDQYPWSPKQIANIACWLEGDAGLVGDVMGAVTSSGTAPPAVTLSGTAAFGANLIIQITTAGPRGTAKFRWSVDGGRSWVAQDVLTAASVALDPFGITAAFATGTNYSNDNVYVADTYIGGWNTLAGTINFVKLNNSYRPLYKHRQANGKPGLDCTANTSKTALVVTGLNIAPPYSIWCVARQISNVATRAPVGLPNACTGPIFYANGGAGTMSFNVGTMQVNSGAITLSNVNTFVGVCRTAGGNNFIRVNGTQTTGASNGGNNCTGICLGDDVANAWWWDDAILAFGLVPAVLSTDECLALEARYRAKYGTV